MPKTRAVKPGREMMPGSMFGAICPAACKPEDVFRHMCQRRETCFFIDTMARGHYTPTPGRSSGGYPFTCSRIGRARKESIDSPVS